MIRKILIAFAVTAGIIIITALAFVLYLQFTEYKPAPIEIVSVTGRGSPLAAGITEFSMISWNIGYGGLGSEADFFYDGGKMVRPPEDYVKKTFATIRGSIQEMDSIDFIMIQEIDVNAKRTFFHDQLKDLENDLSQRSIMFAYNYRVAYIPTPLSEPLGKVDAGLALFSRYIPENAERHAYEAFFPWPTRLAMLKRCFLVSFYTLGNGKQLVIVNLHNSAYDNTGELRKKELKQLSEFLQREYQKGNFVVAGGDWNMNPPGFDPGKICNGDRGMGDTFPLKEQIMQGWEVVYDPNVPTNRLTDAGYEKGKTGTHVIDFFLFSPNVTLLQNKTIDRSFDCSDHNPVYTRFRVNE